MKSLLAYVALACSLALTPVSSTLFTGKDGKGIGSAHGVENWKALVEGGLAVPPKEARIGKRAEETSSVENNAAESSTAESTTITSTATKTTDDTSTSSITETPTEVTTTTATGPSPWVSLDPEGSPVDVTPIPTTDAEGKTSTMNLAPTHTPLVDTDKDSDTHSVYLECSESGYENSGKWEPFCRPHNGSVWRVDEKGGDGFYYVTWNPDVFERNETLFLSLNYANHTDEQEAEGVWTKEAVPANVGWTTVQPKSDWLEDSPNKDTVEVFLMVKGSRSKLYVGPTLTITTKPKPPPVDTSPSNRPPVNTLGLAIGLPLVIVFILAVLIGTHFCMKERRKVGPIHIGGVRGRKEYGTRMSRRQRMKGGAVPLSSGEGYSDDRDDNEDLPPSVPRNNTGSGWELTDVQGGRARGFDEDAQEYRDEHRRF